MKQIFSMHATNKELALRKTPIEQLVKHKQFQRLAHFLKDQIMKYFSL